MNHRHNESADLPFNIWIFGGLWILISVLGERFLEYLFLELLPTSSISAFSFEQELWSFNFFLGTLIFVIASGLIIGGGQWFLLQRYFKWPATWVVAYMIGEFAIIVWSSSVITPLLNPDTNFFLCQWGL